jgi:transcriptional regulator with XRE-family HTH domain
MSYSPNFIQLVQTHRKARHWTLAELARRAKLTQPEVSRIESGHRNPTIRIVRGLARAFAEAPSRRRDEPSGYERWLSILVELAEDAREEVRASRREG